MVSCTSLGHRIEVSGLQNAIESYNSNPDESLKNFENLCQSRNKLACQLSGKKVNWYPGTAILQAPSASGEALFVVAYDGSAPLRFVVQNSRDHSLLFPEHERLIRPEGSNQSLYHVQFRNNQLQNDSFVLIVYNELGELLDDREFEWDHPRRIEKLRFAVLSCMKDSYKGTEEIWDEVQRKDPELLLMIGDASYLTVGLKSLISMDQTRIWTRHMQTRMKLKVFRWKKIVPILAVWDDHDYGVNNGGRLFKNKAVSARIFRQFFPLSENDPNTKRGEGVGFARSFAFNNFIFLDNRSFRDEKNKQGDHLGKKQRQWLLENLNSKHWNWIIKGDQFYGGYHPFESFQGDHPQAFSDFKKNLKQKQVHFSLVSGDRHLSEIIEIPATEFGEKRYEFTSSPAHSSVYPGASYKYKNPWRRQGVDGQWNFLMFETHQFNKEVKVQVQSLGRAGQIFFKESYDWSL